MLSCKRFTPYILLFYLHVEMPSINLCFCAVGTFIHTCQSLGRVGPIQCSQRHGIESNDWGRRSGVQGFHVSIWYWWFSTCKRVWHWGSLTHVDRPWCATHVACRGCLRYLSEGMVTLGYGDIGVLGLMEGRVGACWWPWNVVSINE